MTKMSREQVERIRVALGADEAIELKVDPRAGPLAVAAAAMAVRRDRQERRAKGENALDRRAPV